LSEQVEKDLLWIREPFVGEPNDFEKTVVFGHTPFPEPLVQPGKIGIDTGAVYGNRLTCVRLPDMTFFDDK
jgi:serine/threonine protein phosphatase 1